MTEITSKSSRALPALLVGATVGVALAGFGLLADARTRGRLPSGVVASVNGKYIYEEQLRIPLILWFSDGRAKGVRVEGIAEQVDVLPTLAELSGEPALDPPTEGHSLLERLDGRIVEKTWAFAQRRAFEAPGPGSASNSNYDPGDRFALITPRFKYILWTDGDDELYDLSSDPHERENLAATGHPDERSLREALQRLIDHYRTRAAAAGEGVDAETKEQLRALGYTE